MICWPQPDAINYQKQQTLDARQDLQKNYLAVLPKAANSGGTTGLTKEKQQIQKARQDLQKKYLAVQPKAQNSLSTTGLTNE